ncbi:restriction endonuclease subunit S [Vibrio parahaemolyticus]|nr:restriction endonuclease subunit S [Vibrio parahaemolyticus]
MSFDWPEVRLGDYIDSCLGKMLDKKKNKGTLQPYLGNSNVRWGNFDLNDLAQMKFEDSEHERYSLESGDLVVCEGGEPGRCAIWEGEVEGMKIQKALHRVRPNQYLNNYYLYYWFLYAGKTGSLEPYFTGTTIKHLTGRALANLPIRIPPLDIQLQCVSVLCSLDKKISHNIKTNQTLEQMAQAIFKSWFVDFDPVKAKMNGEQPEGMDAATASLFPEKLVESELGLIPEGWEVLESQKVATVAIGKTPPRKEPQWFSENPENVTWISIKDMGNAGTYALDSSEYLTPEAVDKFNVKVIPDNTLILSFKLTVGRVAITHGEMTTNEAIAHYKLADDARVSTNFLYSYMKQFNFESLGSTSSIAKAVNSKIIKALPIIVPSKEILDSFDALVKPLFDKIKSNQMENQNLEALRDTLLPKLLSGEIELGQAQELAEVE